MFSDNPSLRQLCSWVSPLKSAVHSQFLPRTMLSARCGVWFFTGFPFFWELGHFFRKLAARLLEWSPHQQQAVGRQGEQEHLQAILPPSALYHEMKTTAQVIILLSALPLMSRISTRKTGHTRKIKGRDD